MNDWMHELASHYERTRTQHPAAKLLILFDIDGTILDMRYMIHYILKAFDREHQTAFFDNLSINNITEHESRLQLLLKRCNVPEAFQTEILDYYTSRFWSSDAIFEAHRPFRGIMDVIRWFQIQPRTSVGLNTSRPEFLRSGTLHSLNRLAQEYRVQFNNEFLRMNRFGWNRNLTEAKLEGLRHFREQGYLVFAVVDNEPENLYAISTNEPGNTTLLIHADTIFASKYQAGKDQENARVYVLPDSAKQEDTLLRHINFVWHGINNEERIRDFLASGIHWASMDVRLEPTSHDLVLRRESFSEEPLNDNETLMPFEIGLYRCRQKERGVKLHFRENGNSVERVLEAVDAYSFASTSLWFTSRLRCLKRSGFEKLAERYPGAIIQCPVDFLSDLIIGAPEEAARTLAAFSDWGINRFSLEWTNPDCTDLIRRLKEWGYDITIRKVPDFESFLQATLLQPRSITSEFNLTQQMRRQHAM